jgi:hypothetical protein
MEPWTARTTVILTPSPNLLEAADMQPSDNYTRYLDGLNARVALHMIGLTTTPKECP